MRVMIDTNILISANKEFLSALAARVCKVSEIYPW
ncbi:hypothetical protein CLHOM_17330 [Clostridium homopropionicum DSM 5847]|uniref:Uncharacterized protein n=1 Tax=Clostridium homopropionicum DSM 5847 TaxID=1121318 RepID=A0A0L6Z9K1_9CLOT|nr:hypothetical protein CLHOM_17330 [Clostridium homopropionicum DSM 5847]